ncbi:Thyrotropin-releasing hormone-degrading ectoenzyme [Liparis tanakae]|uniref:Thyrotropin-releasing hormone-degrading ectoenzyme n=1 Tax=Liparis tanakae TaxID=230148 RepID=A0A4Z2EFV9_9TELE|nr:Thyrotropin-releasing hormone-degrading ectoenzyme [Liparis tanakae]
MKFPTFLIPAPPPLLGDEFKAEVGALIRGGGAGSVGPRTKVMKSNLSFSIDESDFRWRFGGVDDGAPGITPEDYLLSHMYGNAARDDLWSKLTQVTRLVRSGVRTCDCSTPTGGSRGRGVEGSRCQGFKVLKGQGLYRSAEMLRSSSNELSANQSSNYQFPVCLVIDRLFITALQAMRSEGRDIDIGQMMDRWTLQMGYPVVTISKNQSEQLATHHATISQEHFLYGQELRSSNRLDL